MLVERRLESFCLQYKVHSEEIVFVCDNAEAGNMPVQRVKNAVAPIDSEIRRVN